MKKKKEELTEFEKAAIAKLYQGASLAGKDGVLTPLIKKLLEAALEGELDAHLEEEKAYGEKPNRKNGKVSKRLKTEMGMLDLETGRDRNSTFEPMIVEKRQTTLGADLDGKIISMYSRGMSYSDIQQHLLELYGVELSKAQLSNITDKVWTEIQEWRSRLLEKVYAIVWMDAIHYKVRHEGQITNRAVYVVIGIKCDGHKDLLGLYASENEGARFWMQVMADLQNRGVQDILISCIDNLKGFKESISSIFPQTEIQLCIVHQIRNSLKYVVYSDSKALLKDLKKVYEASTLEIAKVSLDEFEAKWGSKYPTIIKSWRENWAELSNYFKFPAQIRKMIYTTNTVEGFNRQLRKITKSKAVMPSEDALIKLIYLASQNIIKKWTMPLPKWGLTFQQLSILFPDRMLSDLK
jgi:putative transposase